MNLFQFGKFTLASGKETNFKIDCDAISDEEWDNLAQLVLPILPKFSLVIGVPRGGLKFAEALRKYQSPGGNTLYVDDVWTTGKSMQRIVNKDYPWSGVVLFARGPVPSHVVALFTLNQRLWEQ